MKRGRPNRRKREPMRMPTLPSIPSVRIPWRALIVPPLIVAALVAAADVARSWVDRPVTELTVEGAFQRVRPIEIEAALGSIRSQRFFTLDLHELKDAVAGIDWVDKVEVKRIWPGQVYVRVSEHRAAASWGATGLLNTRGELFTTDARFEYAELPRLTGPEGSEKRVAELYLDVRGRLADANLSLAELSMDERGALTFELAGGQQVRLGREAHEARLQRFFEVAAPTLAADFRRVEYIDLRYPNGFAVGWETPPPAALRLARSDTDG